MTALHNNLLFLILALALVGGCTSTPDSRVSSGAQFPTIPPKTTVSATATLDGRLLEIQRTDMIYGRPSVTYHLVDATTKELLWSWYDFTDGYGHGVSQAVLVPDVGFFVWSDAEVRRWLMPHGDGAFSENAGQALQRKLAGHRQMKNEYLPRWCKLDLTSKQLLDTDIVDITMFRDGEQPVWQFLRRQPDETLERRTIGRLDMDLIAADGTLAGHYEHVQYPSVACGSFRVLRTYKPDDSLEEHILGPAFQYLSTAPRPVTMVNRRMLAIPALGTAPEEDLWVFLQDNGQFGAPPGVIGFRPVYTGWRPRSAWAGWGWASWFLVRFAPEAAHPWGEADGRFRKISEPLWDVAELVMPPTWKRPYAFDGVQPAESVRDASVNSDDAVLDNAVFVYGNGKTFFTHTVVLERKDDAALDCRGESVQQALDRSFALLEKQFADAQQYALSQHHIFMAEQARRQRELDQQELASLRHDIERETWARAAYSDVAPEAAAKASLAIARAHKRIDELDPKPPAVTPEEQFARELSVLAAMPDTFEQAESTAALIPRATPKQLYQTAMQASCIRLAFIHAAYLRGQDGTKQQELLQRLGKLALASDDLISTERACSVLRYSLLNDTSDLVGQLNRKSISQRNALFAAQQAKEAAARNEASARRWAAQSSAASPSGSTYGTSPKTNWADNDYKRGLDQLIQGKTWTAHGY